MPKAIAMDLSPSSRTGKGKFSRSIHSRTDSWSRSLTPKTEIFFAAKSEWLSRYP